MSFHLCLCLLAWAFSLIPVSSTPAPVHIARTYHDASLAKAVDGRKLRRATTGQLFSESLNQQWEGEVLFALSHDAEDDSTTAAASGGSSVESQLGVQIACRTCYITGTVTGSYTYDAGINITALEDSVTKAVNAIIADAEQAVEDLVDGNSNFTKIDFSDVDLPSPKDFDYQLHFQFEDLELYMALDTAFPAESTYTFNLLTLSPAGARLSDDDIGFEIGAFFTVDLILSTTGEIDISSGVHIKVDSAGINIGIFDSDVSGITMDGGMFEFLPVSIVGGDFELSGSLRVGIQAGVGFEFNPITVLSFLDASAGLGAGIYANIAEFTASGTADSSNENCDLALVEGFTIALGAQAGATVALGDYTWGPTPETETPIWYTELATACATLRSPSTSSSSAAITARQAGGDPSVGTTTTETTYSIVSCTKTGAINCPVSDQTTITFSTIVTLTTTESDTSVTAQASISRIPFGANKQDLVPTSGSLVSYSPPPGATSTGSVGTNGSNGGAGKDHKPLIIGLSVGLGVPALAIIAGAMFCFIHRRKRYTTPRKTEMSGQVIETPTSTPGLVPEQQPFLKKTPTVVSVEAR